MLVFIYLRMLICECSGTFYATCYCMYIYCVCIIFCQSGIYCFNDCQVDSHTAFTIRHKVATSYGIDCGSKWQQSSERSKNSTVTRTIG